MEAKKIISAQVALASAGGAVPQSQVTSRNIQEFLPSPQTVSTVTKALQSMGFEVGPAMANSMSITGPARLFEQRFKTKIRQTANGGVVFADGGHELSANKLPESLAGHVVAVVFSAPPDYGPGASFSM